MNQEKIGTFIKDLRKKNNLTQQQLAQILGVTYQAVSKWETGKNIPDISVIKQISDYFNIDISEVLNGEVDITKKDKNRLSKKWFLIISIIACVVILLTILLIRHYSDNDYEFKTLSTTCDEFKITGSVAYNKAKSSIYIANVNYCGDSDDTEYKNISCILYESHDNIDIKISECSNKENSDITLNDYLQDIQFAIDDYEANCKNLESANLYLKINATDTNNKTTSYTIPLTLNQVCN